MALNTGCLPATPTAEIVRPSGADTEWKSLAGIPTTALLQYYPVSATVLQFDNMGAAENQQLEVVQLQVRETAAATRLNPALIIYLYSTAPTAPTLGAVYEANATEQPIGVIVVPATYERISTTQGEATVNPARYIRTGGTSTSSTIYAVVLANAGVTFAASAAVAVNLRTKMFT